MILAHRVIGPEVGPTAFLLHGILGSGTNLMGFARGLATRHPLWRFVVPDLRGHGDSGPGAPPHTVAACADDLQRLAAVVGSPQVVVGHSFGGKVALIYAQRATVGSGVLRDVWVLDAPPGAARQTSDHEVRRVLAAARALPTPVASREAVTAHFLAAGFSTAIATWMTTNITRRADGLVFKPDLAVIEALLEDYFMNDLWGLLEAPPAGLGLHMLRAGKSDRWDAATLARLAAAPIDVRVLPDAGHWVHVDDPAGVMACVGESLA